MYLFRYIHNRRKIEGKAPIELRVQRSRRDRHWISTRIIVDPEHWDDEKQVVVKHPQRVMYNARLRQIMLDLENMQTVALRSGRQLSFEQVRDLLQGRRVVQRAVTFDGYIEECLRSLWNVAVSTRKDQEQALVILRKYRTPMPFTEISRDGARDFFRWMTTLKYASNTMAKQNKNLKRYIHMAVKAGLITQDQVDGWSEIKTPYTRSNRVPLSMQSLDKIASLEYTSKQINAVRDMFLFSCYTGLRYVDMQRLQSSMITREQEQVTLSMKTQKKGFVVHLPLNDLFGGRPAEILKRHSQEGFVFKRMSNDTVNTHLKTIAGDAGIKHPLTFHYSRHTFLSIMAMKLKNPFLLMHYAGIVKMDTAMIYINIASQVSGEELKGIKW